MYLHISQLKLLALESYRIFCRILFIIFNFQATFPARVYLRSQLMYTLWKGGNYLHHDCEEWRKCVVVFLLGAFNLQVVAENLSLWPVIKRHSRATVIIACDPGTPRCWDVRCNANYVQRVQRQGSSILECSSDCKLCCVWSVLNHLCSKLRGNFPFVQ